MKFLAIFVILFFSACGSSSSTSGSNACALIGANTKIINGQVCKDFSHSPIVRMLTEYSDTSVNSCTGMIISPSKVLTAAHCVINLSNLGARVTELVVISGDYGTQTIHHTTGIHVHPGFSFEVGRRELFNDIAVVTISPNSTVTPQILMTDSDVAVGTELYIYGYGQTSHSQSNSRNLDELLDSMKDLRGASMLLENATNNHYWARFTGGRGMICYGDSGGPLIVAQPRPMLIGVASQVDTCQPGGVAIWTRIQSSEVINWLRAVAPDAIFH